MRHFVSACALGLAAAGSVLVAQSRPQVVGFPSIPVTSGALFDGRAVQEIRLSLNTIHWQTLKERFLEDTYYPADFRWRASTVRNVGIRSRGTGSRSGTKPGLKVDFGQYVKGQTFLGLKTLVLRNNTQDPSNLHERVSMLLFDRLGLPASRETHALLYINDQYAGLYTVVEPVDKQFLSRVYGENGGYLFEYEYPVEAAPYRFEYRGSSPELYVPMPFKPQTHEDDARPEFVERLIWTINLASSAVFREAIGEFLDVSRVLRHVAAENFLADTDGVIGDYGLNNFYMYRGEKSTRFDVIPWDKSEAFKGGASFGIFHNLFDIPVELQNRLLARLLSYPDVYEMYLNSQLECAASADERSGSGDAGWLEREIQFEYQQVRVAALADPVKPFSNQQFEDEVLAMLAFARTRAAFVVQSVGAARSGQASGVRTSEPASR